jgi:hypothetical protein
MLATAAGEAEGVAFLTGGATVLAAVVLGGLAAWTSERRLGRQLKAEDDRLKATLDHDRELSRSARRHERELADLADLRALLDEAAVALDRSEDRVLAIESTVRLVDEASKRTAILSDERKALAEAISGLLVLNARLLLRLGNDAITRGFASATNGVFEVDTAADAPETSRDDAKATAANALDRFRREKDVFLKAALQRVGAKDLSDS